jgi:hypothetical protein
MVRAAGEAAGAAIVLRAGIGFDGCITDTMPPPTAPAPNKPARTNMEDFMINIPRIILSLW